jgi:SAM-dependent methyltransferase
MAPMAPVPAPVQLKLSFVEPEGNALQDFEALVPSYGEAAAAVDRVLAQWREPARAAGVRLRVDGFPPCVLAAARHETADLWTEGFVYLVEAFEQTLHRIDDRNKARGGPCRRCSLDGCPGIYRTYLARRGDAELSPVRERRGSAVDYVEAGPVPGFDVRRCPSRAGRLPHPDPRRELLVGADEDGDAGRDPGQRAPRGDGVGDTSTRLYRCEAQDFSESELDRIHRVGHQLYQATDPGEQAEDFGESLAKLRPSDTCARCPHRGACGALWVRARRPVLATDEEEVRGFLAGLTGRVLDVGCGAARYLSALAPRLRVGGVTWHLLDPDPEALAAVRREIGRLGLREGSAAEAGEGTAAGAAAVILHEIGVEALADGGPEAPHGALRTTGTSPRDEGLGNEPGLGSGLGPGLGRERSQRLGPGLGRERSQGLGPGLGRERSQGLGPGLGRERSQGLGPFDHVVCVRSYSHFADVDRAARGIARVLAPGGELTVIGDAAVGLARSRAAVQRARREAPPPEHLRNHGPEQAWEILRDHPFERLEARGVDPEGSNLWWLRARLLK